jgi:Bacterial protein of unknown function (DUF924)
MRMTTASGLKPAPSAVRATVAKAHRDAILRFGRLPHRNRALARTNTPEEQVWLDAGGKFRLSSPINDSAAAIRFPWERRKRWRCA